jgi:phenylalanyl-tRNA synthetase beta chain
MKTAECEAIEPAGALLAGAVLARVEAAEPIGAGHNVKAIVDLGPLGRKTVVCGAPNCRPGMTTVWAPVGTKLIDGVESHGMLASGAELGINKDHSGIIEIAGEPGAPVPGCAPDSVIEIDNKSLTHRPDLWGHVGMAREVAAILGHKLVDPVKPDLLPRTASRVRIAIEDLDLCPRYSALEFDNVTVQPSPAWLQYRLSALGLNPIGNIVDMTNLLMAELPQPTHAFDADRLSGDTIFIRNAHPGERFRGLNNEDYVLDLSNLVIADASGAIALAGVIGGASTAISDKTTRVVLESANFQAASIRKTSSAVKLRTDASIRYEKAQDPANTVRALARAVELLREISPGIRVVGGVADQMKDMPAPPPIELRLEWLGRKLGRALEPAEVRRILESLEFGVAESKPGVFSVSVPSWRATKDVSMADDLVEEVGRMIGYNSITPVAPMVAAAVPPSNPERKFQHEVRDVLVDLGFTEVYNYSFVSEESVRAFGFAPETHLRVTNPIASDQALMRASLLPGLWRNMQENSKHREVFRIFEIGLEIHKRERGLPEEVPHLAAALFARQGDGAAGLDEIRHAAECLMPGAQAQPAAARSYEHPARAADISWKGERVGRVFELHPSLIETGRAAVLDLDLDRVRALAAAAELRYTPIRRYPSSAFDLSVIAGLHDPAGELQRVVRSFAGPLVESIEFLRQYSGPPLETGQKSVSFRLTAGSPDRTLSNDETSAIRARIIDGMRALGYELRV